MVDQEVNGIETCPECRADEFRMVKTVVDPKVEGRNKYSAFHVFCAGCGTLYMYIPDDKSVSIELADQAEKLDVALDEAKYFKRQHKLALKRLAKYESVEKPKKKVDEDGTGKSTGTEKGTGQ